MKKIFLLAWMLCTCAGVFAQVSDEQVMNMLREAQQQGKSQQEMLLMLKQKGVTQEQLLRLKSKYGNAARESANQPVMEDRMRKVPEVKETKTKPKTLAPEKDLPQLNWVDSLVMGTEENEMMPSVKPQRPAVFGREIFNNDLLTFEPNVNIATPETYVLGPGDEVIVDIWGDSEQTFRQRISPDGTITDSKIGPIYLNGVTMKEANARLKNAFSKIYSTMSGTNPTTFINVSLGEIRSIRVNVMGEVVMPGTYTLPSLASVFHALYSAGGVNEIGSLRAVKVGRGGRTLAEMDVYDYLLNGKTDMDIRLEDGDVVLVTPYRNLVALSGKVKRPLIYEMKDNEKVSDLLNFAGGFRGDAYKKAVRIIRKSGREYQVYNVMEEDFRTFPLTDGDSVSVDSVLDRFENRIEVRGAVYRPGLYALGDEVQTVGQVIGKAEGVRGDAFLTRAVIYREKPNLTLEVVAVDVAGILDGSVADIALSKNDVLYIPSIFDLKEEYTIQVDGAVGFPGTYEYADGMTVEDLIVLAGGLKETASVVKIDVARRIKNPKSTTTENRLAENFTLTLKDGLVVDGEKDFTLKPFDQVFVRNSPGYQEQQQVKVSGEVLFEGAYVLAKKEQRLSDLVRDAGGLTPEAYAKGARLIRKMNEDEQARVRALLKLTEMGNGGRDTIDKKRLDIGSHYYVGIELSKALKNPGSEYDVVLREGDELIVPQYSGTVKISGAVMYPNTVAYKKNVPLKHYIGQGGGFAARAKRKRVFVVYMNGTVSKSKLLSKAKVAPGCEIIVPQKPPRKGFSLAEIMGIANSTTSMAALVTSIINSTK